VHCYEWLEGKDLEGSGRNLFEDILPGVSLETEDSLS
jgi:hypothetical protein